MKEFEQKKIRWVKGEVNKEDEHMKIFYGEWDKAKPVALVVPGKGDSFTVQFIINEFKEEEKEKILNIVKKELDFYLLEHPIERGLDAWDYAKHHCNTAANVYGDVHWGYYPKES